MIDPSVSAPVKPGNEDKEEEEPAKLEEEAKKRRERLKALRNKLSGAPAEEVPKIEGDLPKPVFRSYNPSDETFEVKNKAKPLEVADLIKDTLKQADNDTIVEDVDIMNLAPRKPDWDLKRDLLPKLNRLEKRTQRAIAELIIERLKISQESNLAAAVEFSSASQEVEDD